MIPDAAVEAAKSAVRAHAHVDLEAEHLIEGIVHAILEAAAPHMLSHEREEARLAHVDAVVNAETVDRLERELAELRSQLVTLAKEFDDAEGGTLAYTATNNGQYAMRKNAHDQLMYIVDNPYRSQG